MYKEHTSEKSAWVFKTDCQNQTDCQASWLHSMLLTKPLWQNSNVVFKVNRVRKKKVYLAISGPAVISIELFYRQPGISTNLYLPCTIFNIFHSMLFLLVFMHMSLLVYFSLNFVFSFLAKYLTALYFLYMFIYKLKQRSRKFSSHTKCFQHFN